MRNLDLEKFELKHRSINSQKDLDLVIVNRFKQSLKNPTGDMHQDFLHLGLPLSFRSAVSENKSHREGIDFGSTINSHMSKSFAQLDNFIQSHRSNNSLNRSIKDLDKSISAFPKLLDESQISIIKPFYQENTIEQNKTKIALLTNSQKIIKIQSVIKGFLARKRFSFLKQKASMDQLLETYRKKFYVDVENLEFVQISLYLQKDEKRFIIRGKFIDKEKSNIKRKIINFDINVSKHSIFSILDLMKQIKTEIFLKRHRVISSRNLDQHDYDCILFEFNVPLLDKFLIKQIQLKSAQDNLHKINTQKVESQLKNQMSSITYRIANSQAGIFDNSKLIKGDSPISNSKIHHQLLGVGPNKILLDYSINEFKDLKNNFNSNDAYPSFRGMNQDVMQHHDLSYQFGHNQSNILESFKMPSNQQSFNSSIMENFDARRNRIKMIKKRSKYSYVIQGQNIKRKSQQKESVWQKYRKEQEELKDSDDELEFEEIDVNEYASKIQRWFRKIMFKKRIQSKIIQRGFIGAELQKRKRKQFGKRLSILEEVDELKHQQNKLKQRKSILISLSQTMNLVYEKQKLQIEDQTDQKQIIAEYDVKVYQKDSITLDIVYNNTQISMDVQSYEFKIPLSDIEAYSQNVSEYLYQVVSDCMIYDYSQKIFKLDYQAVGRIDKNLKQKLSHLQGKVRVKMQKNRVNKLKHNPFEQEQKRAQERHSIINQNNKNIEQFGKINLKIRDQAETQVSTDKYPGSGNIVNQGIDKLKDINSKEYTILNEGEHQLLAQYQIKDQNTGQNQVVKAFINQEKQILALEAEGYKTLSLFMIDFIQKYKKGNTEELNSRDKIQNFIKNKLPIVTILEKNRIILQKEEQIQIDKSSSSNENYQSVVVLTTELNDRSLNQDELRDLLKSTVNQGENSIQYQFQGSPSKQLDQKNILFNFNFPGLKFEAYPNTNMNALLFKDMMENIFLRINYDKLPKYSFVERINQERVQKLSGAQINNLQGLSDAFLQELNIRIGLANGGLEQNEYMDIKQIENMIKLYGFNTSEKDLEKIQSMQCIIKKTQMIQNAFRKKNKRQKQQQQKNQSINQKAEVINNKQDLSQQQQQTKVDLKPQIKSQSFFQKKTLSQRQNRQSENQVDKIRQEFSNPSTRTINAADINKKIGQFTILKSKTNISGQYCTAEVKANYDNDSLLIRVTPQSKATLELLLPKMSLQTKDLQQLTVEGQQLLDKIEISEDQKTLEFRNGKNDYSILSQDVLYKQGHVIKGRFFLVTLAMEDKHLIIDAYEEKNDKRLEIKIKRQRRSSNSDTNSIPSEKEIKKLIQRLDICQLGIDEFDDQETLTLKQNRN